VQEYPSPAEIEEDLRLVVAGGWGFIRLFDAGPHAASPTASATATIRAPSFMARR